MRSRKSANSDGHSGFADSSTVPAVWSGSQLGESQEADVAESEPMPRHERPTRLVFIGVMPVSPSRRSRWTFVSILLLRVALVACVLVLALVP